MTEVNIITKEITEYFRKKKSRKHQTSLECKTKEKKSTKKRINSMRNM